MNYAKPVTELVQLRFSCRKFSERLLAADTQQQLRHCLSEPQQGPFRSNLRFALLANAEEDRQALQHLGTYGFIKGAAGFVVGAVKSGPHSLLDYGYAMEQLVLKITELGLGSCWLGGSFNKGRFAEKISLTDDELLPAVCAMGYIEDENKARDTFMRRQVGSATRMPREKLFFDDQWGRPLAPAQDPAMSTVLDIVRWAPSASNKQPWRLVRQDGMFHLFLQRTPGYRDGLPAKLMHTADLQMVDMGIAMCHFELAAAAAGMQGQWLQANPGLNQPDAWTEYIVSWQAIKNAE